MSWKHTAYYIDKFNIGHRWLKKNTQTAFANPFKKTDEKEKEKKKKKIRDD